MPASAAPVDSSQDSASAAGSVAHRPVAHEEFVEADAGDGTKAEDQYLHGAALVFALSLAVLCLFLTALDMTIVATILTVVSNKFGDADKIGWLTAGFMLPMAVLAATWGKVLIIFGRKWTMIVAVVLFEVGSVVSATANDMDTLIGGRVISGIGGGGIQTMVFIMMLELVPIQRRPLAMALVAATFAVSSVLGPLLGGAFTDNVLWRWCFYINLPIGGVALAFLVVFFNPPKPKGNILSKLKMIDYLGVFLFAAGMVLVLLGLTFGGVEFPWRSAAVICCFVIGGVVLVGWGVWNFKFSKNPILPADVVSSVQVSAAAVQMCCMYGGFLAQVIYLALYFQVVRNATAWKSGLHLLPMIIATTLSAGSLGAFVRRTRLVKPLAICGACLQLIGGGLVCLLDVDSPQLKQIGLLIIGGVGTGFSMQLIMLLAQLAAPKTPGGMIMSTTYVNMMRAVGGTIASDLGQTVFQLTIKNKFATYLASHPEFAEGLGAYAHDLKDFVKAPDLINKLPTATRDTARVLVMDGFRNVYYFAIGLQAVAFILVWFTTWQKMPKDAPKKPKDEESKVDEASASDTVEDKPEPLGSAVSTDKPMGTEEKSSGV